jgi:uncharacterized phage protein (TIGR01671 family)
MRTIKFRGKRVVDGQWAYGDLKCGSRKENFAIHTYDMNGWYNRGYMVDPATIGQFTGLTDKDGKEIYEGDILLWTRKNVHIEGRPRQDLLYKCVVYYDNDKCSFQFRCELRCGACVGYLDFDDDRADESFVEVIGNVFDNPDLIEKGGQDD